MILFVFSFLCVVALLGGGQGFSAKVIQTLSVFWVLMFAVSLTPPFALAWLALKYVSMTGAIETTVSLGALLSTLAHWVSIGGVVGLLTATISFVPLRFMQVEWLRQDPISLSILADLSLAGAVVGYIAGHFWVLFMCTASMTNRLAAVGLPGLTVSMFTAVTSIIGINPASNASFALDAIRASTVLPADGKDLQALAAVDWKLLLAASEGSLRGGFPGSTTFAVTVAVCALGVAIAMLAPHVKSGLAAAVAERRELALSDRSLG